ncbi:CcoQ/FixQ family Cbb3-type cytochrome c oxidase assembly chaperone [Ideonella sp. DXS29W]|uniref:CcoQ/FixQ family Cbb3-type cytochrome c oxidase assembly chaperone n=1 Tax=Ideonella lacteola TaxID=2984193 RepID=A0ABU9BS82_9BURK
MEFDVNTWRSAITVLSLLLFLGLMAWTLNRRRQGAFDEAAQLPFADPAADAADTSAQRSTLS